MKAWSVLATLLLAGSYVGCTLVAGIQDGTLTTADGGASEAGERSAEAGMSDATVYDTGTGTEAAPPEDAPAEAAPMEAGSPEAGGCTGSSDCAVGQACDAVTHACTAQCSSSQPCNGTCCNGTTCTSPETNTACGAAGTMCSSCAAGDAGAACIASTGSCGCKVASDCPQGEACETLTYTCTKACDVSQPCNGGCCSSPDGGTAGVCTDGLAPSACGNTGGMCQTCAGASVGTACIAAAGGTGGACGCNSATTDCPSNVACSSTHTCETTCSASVPCMGGCCQMNGTTGTCVGGTAPNACGSNGGACTSCSGGTPGCFPSGLPTGVCGCTADSQCPADQACVSGTCGTKCVGTCNGGCCSVAPGATSGTCALGNGAAACGGTSENCAVCSGTTPTCGAADTCVCPCTGSTPACNASGACVCTSTSCATGQVCGSNGQCACTATSCPSGSVCQGTSCAAGCEVGGTFYMPGELSSTGCASCQPNVSTTSLTNLAAGTGCSLPDGGAAVCSGNNVCNACQQGANCAGFDSCQVQTIECGSGSPVCTTQGNVADGTSCGSQVCYKGVCSQGCYISGVYYPDATANSTNPCLYCNYVDSNNSWTMEPPGWTCSGGSNCPGTEACECTQYMAVAERACAPICVVGGTTYLQGQPETGPNGSCTICWGNNSSETCPYFGSGCSCMGGLGEPTSHCGGTCTGVDLDP